MATGVHHYDAIVGIKAAIVALALTDVEGATPLLDERIYIRELWSDLNVKLPCVVVSKAPMPEQSEISDTRDNRITYPCMAVIIAPANQDRELTEGLSRWRQQIEGAFNFKQPTELLEAMSDDITLSRTEWHPLDTIDLENFNKNLFVSAAVILVKVWKPR